VVIFAIESAKYWYCW